MSYRIFMTIHRGTMDKTAVCVYPWEQPLLEEIHGGGATVLELEDMLDKKGRGGVATMKNPRLEASERRLKAKDKVVPAPSQREQLEAMVRVDPDLDPVLDADSEWARLCEKYGMHPDVKMLVTDKVYGSVNQFRRVLREFKGTKPPANIGDILPTRDGSSSDEAAEKPIAELSAAELKALLTKEGIEFKKNASVEELRDLALSVTA